MKRITALLIAFVLLFGLAACGGSAKSYDAPRESNGYYKDEGYYAEAEAAEMPAMAEDSAYGGFFVNSSEQKAASNAPQAPSSSNLAMSMSGVNTTNMKLIYRASIQIQTLDFDKAVEDLNGLVAHYGGYFESAYVDNGTYYSGGSYMQGNYVVRVPSGNYQNFINELGEVAHVVNINQSVQDVGLEYADAETRLETLRTKHDRLIELLSKATEMTDIIELENALTDVEYEIDRYGSKLVRYDSLIGYSTIDISLTKVNRVDPPIEQDNSFLARLSRAFSDGFANFKDGLEDFIIWFAYDLIGIIIFVLVAWLVIRLIIKLWKKRPQKISLKKADKAEPQEQKPEEDKKD